MRANQLFEAATDILFHATRYHRLFDIMSSGTLLLSDATISSLQTRLIPKKGWIYYLSTSRSKRGAYSESQMTDVTLVINGRYFNQHSDFIIKPLDADYVWWKKRQSPTMSEDRIWSFRHEVPFNDKTVLEVHMNLHGHYPPTDHGRIAESIREKVDKFGIPIFLYQKTSDFKVMNKGKAL